MIKKILNPICATIFTDLRNANRLALFNSLNRAKGTAVKASSPNIKANHTMYSLWLAYPKADAIEVENIHESVINKTEVTTNDKIEVL